MSKNPASKLDDSIFPLRLRAARKMAGLSMEDLAKRLGGIVTKQAIGKYEKGLMKPAPEMRERLYEVLEIMPAATPIIRLADIPHITSIPDLDFCLARIQFREGERLPAKMASALRFRILDYIGRYRELESILGTGSAFDNPVIDFQIRTSDDVEKAAAEVRRRWDLGSGPVVNLLGLLENKGILVYEMRGIDNFDGLSGRYEEIPFVAVNRDFSDDRMRFTAAHELAHILCGMPEMESAEVLCHAFAGAFLLPGAAVKKAFAPARRKVTLGELEEIKETFGISLQAIMYRARGLGLVSDRQLRSFRETFKAKGWFVTEPVKYAGKERATRFRKLLHYAVAENILDMEKAAEIAGLPVEQFKEEVGHIF